MAWVSASMPVAAVRAGGMESIISGSLTEMVGSMSRSFRVILLWFASEITANCVTSLPVPAVVATAIRGGMGVLTLSTPA